MKKSEGKPSAVHTLARLQSPLFRKNELFRPLTLLTHRLDSEQTLLPVKILCGCGQKYAFDVEPIDGRMAYNVKCPSCGIDGTEVANQVIAEQLSTDAPGLSVRKEPKTYAPPVSIPRPPPPIIGRQPNRSSTGGKKWLIASIGTLVAGGCLALLFARSHHKSAPVALVLANDGLPHTPRDLNMWYAEPSPGQNAATFYSQGLEELRLDKGGAPNLPLVGKGKLPPPGVPLPGAMKAKLHELLNSNQEALQLFGQGSRYQMSRYPVDLTPGHEGVLPHLAKMRNAVQLLELSAIVHAEEHDGAHGAQDVVSAVGLTRSLQSEPILTSQYMRASCVPIPVAALEQLLGRTIVSPQSLSELSTIFAQAEKQDAEGEAFNRAIAGERACSLVILGAPQEFLTKLNAGLAMPPDERKQWIAALQNVRDVAGEQTCYESAFQQIMSARQEPFPERLKTGVLVRKLASEATKRKLGMSALLIAGLAGTAAREAACLAHIRLGMTATALERFRGTHNNHSPASLSELTPEYLPGMPLDPFDGQPLRYRSKGTGYLLYSIGPDLKDDSGLPSNGKTGDIRFLVGR